MCGTEFEGIFCPESGTKGDLYEMREKLVGIND